MELAQGIIGMEELNTKQSISKANPFVVPDGYFEQLKGDILARAPEREAARVVDIKPKRRFYRPLIGVAASVCIVVFGVSIYMNRATIDGPNEEAASAMSAPEQSFSSDNVSDYIMLDNDDIYRYLCELDKE